MPIGKGAFYCVCAGSGIHGAALVGCFRGSSKNVKEGEGWVSIWLSFCAQNDEKCWKWPQFYFSKTGISLDISGDSATSLKTSP